MGKHLRKLFSADQVKEVFRRYQARQIGVDQASAMLKIQRRQFFKLLKVYRQRPENFSLDYTRKVAPRKIDAKAEAKITQELRKEAAIIRDKSNPVGFTTTVTSKRSWRKSTRYRCLCRRSLIGRKKWVLSKKAFSKSP